MKITSQGVVLDQELAQSNLEAGAIYTPGIGWDFTSIGGGAGE